METNEIKAEAVFLLNALKSIVIQAGGDLSDAEFRKYVRDVIAGKAIEKVESHFNQ